jgi:hypothetical protein
VNCAAHEDSVPCLGDVVQFDMQVRIAFQIGAIDANAPRPADLPGGEAQPTALRMDRRLLPIGCVDSRASLTVLGRRTC